MDIYDAIHSRRSVRKYSRKKISDDDLRKIIDAGTFAPSACDIQGWRFIIIDDDTVKMDLVDKGAASFIRNAPTGIIVLYDNQTENLEYADHIQSAAACIQNMILEAYSLGIGSCWICHLPGKREIRALLSIPRHYDPVAYITLGYPDGKIRQRKRKYRLDDLISRNKYEFRKNSTKSGLKLSIRRLMRRVYYLLPFRGYIRKKVDDRFEKRFD